MDESFLGGHYSIYYISSVVNRHESYNSDRKTDTGLLVLKKNKYAKKHKYQFIWKHKLEEPNIIWRAIENKVSLSPVSET